MMESGGSVQLSIQEQLLHGNMQRSRGGLAFKAHRLLYDSALGLRVIKKKRKDRSAERDAREGEGGCHGRCRQSYVCERERE